MSTKLEDFIKNSRDKFDDLEPANDVWSRIEKGLPQQIHQQKSQKKTFSLGFVLRMVAVVVLVMSIGFALYLHNEKKDTVNLADINPEYARQQVQYVSLIADKRTALKAVSKSDPQLYKEFSAEFSKMDSIYKKLKSDLVTSPNREEVLRAMIRNLQIQAEVLNQQLNVIEQYNKMKMEQKNEIKNI